MPAAFRFDPSLTPDDNLEKFWKHLAGINSEFTLLLQENVELMIPLPPPEQTAARTDARTKFHAEIAKVLDKPKK